MTQSIAITWESLIHYFPGAGLVHYAPPVVSGMNGTRYDTSQSQSGPGYEQQSSIDWSQR